MLKDVACWHKQLHGAAGVRPHDEPPVPSIVRFRDIDARIGQPALDADVLAIHLGGPKRVIRRHGPYTLDVDVPENALTVMPAREAFQWETYGPVDFAHLRLDQALLREVAADAFDRDPDSVRIEPAVGMTHPRLASCFHLLLDRRREADMSRLERDALALVLSIDVLRACSAGGPSAGKDGALRSGGEGTLRSGTLATWQLRRVIDYMRENLADDIEMDSLISLTGLGRARFFQAFRTSMGCTPFAHLLHLRLLHARGLLTHTRLSMTGVAMEVGLSPTQFAVAFRRAHGTTPRAYRAANALRSH